MDATVGHKFLAFLNAFSWYNQIYVHLPTGTIQLSKPTKDFIIVMPFRLKNSGAMYQWFVTQMCADHIGKMVEVYVDDILVNSRKENQHVA